MPGPFDSAYLKLAWGREHIDKLEGAIADFLHVCPYEMFAEPHPDKRGHNVHKVRPARDLPDSLSLIAGDAVDNLRAALDHAVFAVSLPTDNPETRQAVFPFAGDETRLDAVMKRRCSDVPKEIWPCLRSFQPYKGGNDLLFALSRACNRNKHALLLALALKPVVLGESLRGTGFIGIPIARTWNSAKKEMELFTSGPDTEYHANFDFRILIVIPVTGLPQSEQASTVLNSIAGEVERVLLAIEAESRRLGFC